MLQNIIFHICTEDEWRKFQLVGNYIGSSQDLIDNFIHFSTMEQIEKSAAKHRAGQDNLIILTVDAMVLGKKLKWEPSRGGELFPHLYGTLPIEAVIKVDQLKLGANKKHIFPDGILNYTRKI